MIVLFKRITALALVLVLALGMLPAAGALGREPIPQEPVDRCCQTLRVNTLSPDYVRPDYDGKLINITPQRVEDHFRYLDEVYVERHPEAALVVNTAQAEFELFSSVFAFYFFPHVLEFGIPILMFKLGLAEKDAKCILPTIAITMGSYTLIHFINVLLNGVCSNKGLEITVNYMYSLRPENPLLQLFYNWIPVPYWYMYCIVPIIAVYLAAVYAPQLVAAYKSRKIKETV